MIKKKKISPYRKLTVAYKVRPNSYAYCGKCNEGFIDNIPSYGSLLCPNSTSHPIPYAVIRGLTKEQLQMKIRRGKKLRKAQTGVI